MIPFGSYYLVQRLAVGGMAEVFLAARRDEPERGLLVVKRILPHLQSKDDFLQMFIDEGELTSRLNHPNLVSVKDHGEADGMHFIAMEHVDGLSLSGIQRTQGDRALDHALGCWIIAESCEGLAYAHSLKDDDGQPLNVVHRDISPDNILLSRGGEVKLADFGVAKAALQLTKTRPGQIKGKLSYMSPEQGMRLKVDRRSDVFSLGIVLYELTTGKRLFDAASEVEVLRALYQREYTPPEQLVPGYPPWLAAIVNKALKWDPDGRYDDALQLREALLEGIPEEVDPPGDLAALVRRLCKLQSDAGRRTGRAAEETEPVPRPTAITNRKGETILGVGEVQRVLANYAAGKAAARMTQEVPEMANATIEEIAPIWDPPTPTSPTSPTSPESPGALAVEHDTIRDFPGDETEPIAALGPDTLAEEDRDTVPRLVPLDDPTEESELVGGADDLGDLAAPPDSESLEDDTEQMEAIPEHRAPGKAEAAPDTTAQVRTKRAAAPGPSGGEESLSDSGFQPVGKTQRTYEFAFDKSSLKEAVQKPWLLLALITAALSLLAVVIALTLW